MNYKWGACLLLGVLAGCGADTGPDDSAVGHSSQSSQATHVSSSDQGSSSVAAAVSSAAASSSFSEVGVSSSSATSSSEITSPGVASSSSSLFSSVISSSSSSSSSERDLSTAVNARDFGLTSGVSVDQSGYLDDAIAHVYNNAAVDTVYVPAGTYYIARDIRLRAGVHLMGDGIGQTVFERNNEAGYLMGNARNNNLEGAVVSHLSLRNAVRTVLLRNVSNLTFSQVEFHGGIVRFENSAYITLDGNVFNDNLGKAAYASDGCDNITITNNRFNSIEDGSINLSGHSNSYVANNYITANSVLNSGYAGIRLPNTAYNNVVEDNTIINHGRGIFILSSSHHNTVRNNVIDTTRYQALFVEASDNLIEDNRIIDAGDEAIYVNSSTAGSSPTPSNAERNTLRNNIIEDTKPNSGSRFIGLRIYGSGNQVLNNQVSASFGRTFKDISSANTDEGNRYE